MRNAERAHDIDILADFVKEAGVLQPALLHGTGGAMGRIKSEHGFIPPNIIDCAQYKITYRSCERSQRADGEQR